MRPARVVLAKVSNMKRLLLFLCFSVCVFGQTVNALHQPDCIITFNFTATGISPPASQPSGFDNRFIGCSGWVIQYSNYNFSPVSVVLQSAPNNNGIAGTWGTFSGQTICNGGSNPSSSATVSAAWLSGYNPFVRVSATVTGTGVLSGTAFGYKDPALVCPVVSASFTPVGTQDVNLKQVAGTNTVQGGVNGSQGVGGLAAAGQALAGNPNLVGGSDGTNVRDLSTDTQGNLSTKAMCNLQALFNLSGSGNTTIVTGTASQLIRVCHISFSTASPEDIKLTSGTGTNCGTGGADVTGLYKSVNGLALDLGGVLTAPSGANLCINQSASQALGGIVTYSVF
jgi:hypothetical protein